MAGVIQIQITDHYSIIPTILLSNTYESVPHYMYNSTISKIINYNMASYILIVILGF